MNENVKHCHRWWHKMTEVLVVGGLSAQAYHHNLVTRTRRPQRRPPKTRLLLGCLAGSGEAPVQFWLQILKGICPLRVKLSCHHRIRFRIVNCEVWRGAPSQQSLRPPFFNFHGPYFHLTVQISWWWDHHFDASQICNSLKWPDSLSLCRRKLDGPAYLPTFFFLFFRFTFCFLKNMAWCPDKCVAAIYIYNHTVVFLVYNNIITALVIFFNNISYITISQSFDENLILIKII